MRPDISILRERRLLKATKKKKLKILAPSNLSRLSWNSPIVVKCLQCSLVMRKRLDTVFDGTGCRACASAKGFSEYRKTQHFADAMKKRSIAYATTTADYKARISKVHNGTIQVIGNYNHKGTTKHKCLVCGHTWGTMRTDYHLAGAGCPGVCKRQKMSNAKLKPVTEMLTLNPEYLEFQYKAGRLTGQVYRKFKQHINPTSLPRTYHEYQVDHIYSMSDAFLNPKDLKNPINLRELCHPVNLRMLLGRENKRKGSTSLFTAAELRLRIRQWNKVNGKPFTCYANVIRIIPT